MSNTASAAGRHFEPSLIRTKIEPGATRVGRGRAQGRTDANCKEAKSESSSCLTCRLDQATAFPQASAVTQQAIAYVVTCSTQTLSTMKRTVASDRILQKEQPTSAPEAGPKYGSIYRAAVGPACSVSPEICTSLTWSATAARRSGRGLSEAIRACDALSKHERSVRVRLAAVRRHDRVRPVSPSLPRHERT